MNTAEAEINRLEAAWQHDRWSGTVRHYSAADVVKLRGREPPIEHSHASRGATKLWRLLTTEPFVRTFGALTGNQAVQMVHAGLKAIYVSGWQVAADANTALQTYPDQSLYPANSAPTLVHRINNAFDRANQIWPETDTDWFAPIVADAEAGFGGPLNAFELMKAFIAAGAAGVHFEDQVAAYKKCGHLGGKVLVSTQDAIRQLTAARLAADVLNVPTILIARTDAYSAKYLQNDIDPRDHAFLTGERSTDGFYKVRSGIESAIARSISYAPYADLLWWETSEPDLTQAEYFAEAVHEQFPGKMLAYNCSPSFLWKKNLSESEIASFQERIGAMGYAFQFITLAGFHLLNIFSSLFSLAYTQDGMTAYVEMIQELERQAADPELGHGYLALKHQEFVGTGVFDEIMDIIAGGESSLGSLKESTEEEQF